jgi:hypothetical protein
MSLRFALSLLGGVAVVAFIVWGVTTQHPVFVLISVLILVPLWWWFEYIGLVHFVQWVGDKLRGESRQ